MLHTFKSLFIVLAFASLGSASVGWDFTAPGNEDTAMVIDGGSGPSNYGIVVGRDGTMYEAVVGIGLNGGKGILGSDATGLVADGYHSYPAIVATQHGTSAGVTASGYDVGVYGGATGYSNSIGVFGAGTQGLYPHGVKGTATTNTYYAYQTGIAASATTGSAPMNTTGLGAHGQGNGLTSPNDNAYGVWATASGAGGLNYGIYANGSSVGLAGYFDGDITVTGTCNCTISDEKLKKNVRPLDRGLSTVMALQPKAYDMKVEEYKDKINLAKGPQIGLIAQDVEKLVPELVTKVYVPQRNPKAGEAGSTAPAMDYKTLNYVGLIPVLIKAIQEQEAKIQALEKLVNR